jgi:aryl-alcohol dehydrogenase-like predicted oxidoreductase
MNLTSNDKTKLGGTFTFPGTSKTARRMGYGAMQLAGPGVFGPPKDRNAALAALRQAVSAGVNHIDTSDFYGPHVTNELIRAALHPYPDGHRHKGWRSPRSRQIVDSCSFSPGANRWSP